MVKKSLLPYGVSSSDPAFDLPDVAKFQSEKTIAASSFFNAKLKQLEDEYDKLVEQAKDTLMVFNAHYNFVPKIGHTYHLYNDGDRYVLSMIENWNRFEYVDSFQFTSDSTWIKIK